LPKSDDIDYQEYAVAAERLPVRFEQMSLRMALADANHFEFLDFLEKDDCNWHLHLFFADKAAISVVTAHTDGTVGPGNAIGFDPQEFIRERLRNLEKSDRIRRRYPWWIED
jgi:hypothetical protein